MIETARPFNCMALALVQIEVKRWLDYYDKMAADDYLRDGPSIMTFPPDEREAEIKRRHGEMDKRRVLRGWR